MEDSTFKSVLFGGFKREDVINYIAKVSTDSNRRIEALEADVDRLCSQERELRNQINALTEERNTLAEKLRLSSDTCDMFRDSLSSMQSEHEKLHADITAFQKEVSVLRPQATEFAAVKAHIADIELEARRRNDELEASTRERLSAMLQECQLQCEKVLSTLGETCAYVSGELRKADASICTLPSAFSALRKGLNELDQSKKAKSEET